MHFAFGLLPAYPCREVFVRVASVRGFWGYFPPLILMMALSSLYELIEWAATVMFGGDLGMNYLGTQGDEWEGQRDMVLAVLVLRSRCCGGGRQHDAAARFCS